jgi:hypothetical protein
MAWNPQRSSGSGVSESGPAPSDAQWTQRYHPAALLGDPRTGQLDTTRQADDQQRGSPVPGLSSRLRT